MFDELYKTEYWRRRQREGPLAQEREAFLESCAARGDARTTLTRKAERARVLARLLESWPPGHRFGPKDLQRLADSYVKDSKRCRGKVDLADVTRKVMFSSREFLGFLGRLAPQAIPAAERYAKEIRDFIQEYHVERGDSPHTIKQSRDGVIRFLSFMQDRIDALSELTPTHIDAYLHYMGQRWSRGSMSTLGYMLRAWVRVCERHGWVRKGLSESIMIPKVYSQEGLPLGPGWDEVRSVVGDMNDRIRKLLRDRAVLLLLAVYGLRAGEVCAIRLEDVDWDRSRLRIRSSKSLRETVTSLEPGVGEAILAYQQFGRPESTRPELFLRVDSPIGPMTKTAVYGVAKGQSARVLGPKRGWNPHAFRHACARHLLGAGYALKRISDHLIHRSIRSTTVYAKVDLRGLREVAFEDLGGLA
jgi:site-specific recombinase XerD